ncbi:phosphatase PAP2 family protein [Sphingomonas sp. R86521]|uniref:phosphatase PAP2 family protein n=1 Tax=Sphingomonas sp. R86521 TaxID=3093860 RepID=UPI0036D4307F
MQIGVSAGAVALGLFNYSSETLNSIAIAISLLIGLAIALRWLEVNVASDLVEIIALLLALMIASPLCTIVLASANFPLADPLLKRLDDVIFLGVDRDLVEALLRSDRSVLSILRFAYDSINFQPFLLVLTLCLGRFRDRAWCFITAWAIALTITALVSPLFPAYGTSRSLINAVETHMRVRSGDLHVLGADALRGIVYFPSFHAEAAVLLGWFFAPVRIIGRPMILMNILMLFSAVICGNHYLVDLLAGSAVAALSIYLSERMLRPELIGQAGT